MTFNSAFNTAMILQQTSFPNNVTRERALEAFDVLIAQGGEQGREYVEATYAVRPDLRATA